MSGRCRGPTTSGPSARWSSGWKASSASTPTSWSRSAGDRMQPVVDPDQPRGVPRDDGLELLVHARRAGDDDELPVGLKLTTVHPEVDAQRSDLVRVIAELPDRALELG